LILLAGVRIRITILLHQNKIYRRLPAVTAAVQTVYRICNNGIILKYFRMWFRVELLNLFDLGATLFKSLKVVKRSFK